ncbi:MBL fold metallo-hydrolase [Rhizobium leguminosarum]|uniref:MBL fold metallo-hydrolase n=2 Tax=Rhizobium leguminosarum TaxID=384 RepID=UPI001C90735A|nr:MBL fold metallo-hydrolase [Rhizobium leguminosarum]MBY2919721.1 MBL fold metallo-hydrolase [Rhizobium leguminosarum]MBY2975415.1 MBL fold metallo-hydrolase [Rhizobium leguminosarum]MBY2977657.1 MBL fold metallo-hydrolase [Rhizobium leguminosarum]MBY3006207.1 MBL fold metallo-hydrolase [Rhizobium leguminosarum]
MLDSRILLVASSVIAVAVATSVHAQMSPQQPDTKAFKIGSLDVVALHDAQFVLPNDIKIFGIGHTPEEVGEILKAAGAPTDTVTLSVDALLVREPKRVVLIDTGVGGALQQSLDQAGTKPEEITDVLITHSHPDHMGGLVKDGKLAFPEATIRMSAAEWAFAKKNTQLAEIVKVINSHVKTFKPGAKIGPNITSVGLKGHTPGHVGYQIASGKAMLFDIGDTVHSSIISLVKPEWAVGFDNDEKGGEKNRIDTLKKLAKSNELVFTPHFPFPGVGHIQADGDHFKWEASVPEAK